MSGQFLKVNGPPHKCDFPRTSPNAGTIYKGSTWMCDTCKRVWRADHDIDEHDIFSRSYWHLETRKERKRREKEERRRQSQR